MWQDPYHWRTPGVDEEGSPGLPAAPERRQAVLRVVALLNAFGAMTHDQILHCLDQPDEGLLEDATSLHLVVRGWSDHHPRAPLLYRAIRPPQAQRLASQMTPQERLGVWGHRPPIQAGGFLRVRHDVLAANCALRMPPERLCAVMGEPLSKATFMIGQDWQPGHGDLVLVLDWGLRLVIEISASVSHAGQTAEKLNRWASALMQAPPEHLGIQVVLMEAGPFVHSTPHFGRLRRHYRHWVEGAWDVKQGANPQDTGDIYGERREWVRRSIWLATYHQWFPRGQEVASACPVMQWDPTASKWIFQDALQWEDNLQPDSNEWFAPLFNADTIWSLAVHQMAHRSTTPPASPSNADGQR